VVKHWLSYHQVKSNFFTKPLHHNISDCYSLAYRLCFVFILECTTAYWECMG